MRWIEAYLAWVQRLLGLVDGGPIRWEGDPQFEVRIVDSPEEMDAALEAQAGRRLRRPHDRRLLLAVERPSGMTARGTTTW